MKKCNKCKGRGIVYVPNIRVYKTGKTTDLGYWDVCLCEKKNMQKKQNSVKITRYNLKNNYALQKRKVLFTQLQRVF